MNIFNKTVFGSVNRESPLLLWLIGSDATGLRRMRETFASGELPCVEVLSMESFSMALTELENDRLRPDILLLDLLKDRSLLAEWVKQLRRVAPHTTLVVLAEDCDMARDESIMGELQECLVKSEVSDPALRKLVFRAYECQVLKQRLEKAGQSGPEPAAPALTPEGEPSQESQDLVTGIMDSLPAQIALLNEKGCIQKVNRAWRDFAEQNSARAEAVSVGINYLEICEQAGSDKHARDFASGFKQVVCGKANSYFVEYPCHSPTEQRWFRCWIFRIPYGPESCILVAHLLVTDRKLADMKLIESEERFDLAMRGAQDGLWDWNLLTNEVYFSPRWKGMLGYRPDELGDSLETWKNLLHPEDRQLAEERVTRFLDKPRSSYESEFRMVHKSGHSVHILARGFLVCREGDGRPVRMVGTHMDITESKTTQEMLQSTVARLNALSSIIDKTCEVTHTDLKGNITYVNDRFCNVSGYTREELLGHNHRIFKSGVHPDAVYQDLWKTISADQIWRGDVCNRAKDGRIYWMDSTVGPLLDEGGKHQGYIALRFDINERKQAEKAVKSALRSVNEITSVLDKTCLISRNDQDGRLTYVNDRLCQVSGYSREELLGQHYRILGAGRHEDVDYEERSKALLAGKIWRCELCNHTKQGHVYWVDASIGKTVDAEGRGNGYLVIRYPITERKLAEVELRKSKRFLDTVVDNLPYAVFIKEAKKHRFIRLNNAAEDLTGFSRKEMLGKSDLDFFPKASAEVHVQSDLRVIQNNRIESFEEIIETRHRGIRFIRTTKVPIFSDTGEREFLLTIAEDITEQKQIEKEIADMNRRLLAASHQAGQAEVATNVLHNIGNVLNSVNVSVSLLDERIIKEDKFSGFVKVTALLKEKGDDLPGFFAIDPRGVHLPNYLHSFGQYLGELKAFFSGELSGLQKNVDHIKSIVVLQQSLAKLSGITESVDPVEMIEDALLFNKGALERHQLTIIKEIEKVPAILVDKNKVLQILVNLFSNAKYACDEGGKSEKRIVLGLRQEGDYIQFIVNDNGVGIPAGNLTRIFNHGFSTRKEGHGFGLHGSANAADELGGKLTVHSDGPGKGATFVLELPLIPRGKLHGLSNPPWPTAATLTPPVPTKARHPN